MILQQDLSQGKTIIRSTKIYAKFINLLDPTLPR